MERHYKKYTHFQSWLERLQNLNQYKVPDEIVKQVEQILKEKQQEPTPSTIRAALREIPDGSKWLDSADVTAVLLEKGTPHRLTPAESAEIEQQYKEYDFPPRTNYHEAAKEAIWNKVVARKTRENSPKILVFPSGTSSEVIRGNVDRLFGVDQVVLDLSEELVAEMEARRLSQPANEVAYIIRCSRDDRVLQRKFVRLVADACHLRIRLYLIVSDPKDLHPGIRANCQIIHPGV